MRLRCTDLLHDGIGLLFIFPLATSARAEELRVFAQRAIATVLDAVGAQFEYETGYKLAVTSDLGAGLEWPLFGGSARSPRDYRCDYFTRRKYRLHGAP
jgi:hypothetical protein